MCIKKNLSKILDIMKEIPIYKNQKKIIDLKMVLPLEKIFS